jgi:hypothetical protein
MCFRHFVSIKFVCRNFLLLGSCSRINSLFHFTFKGLIFDKIFHATHGSLLNCIIPDKKGRGM